MNTCRFFSALLLMCCLQLRSQTAGLALQAVTILPDSTYLNSGFDIYAQLINYDSVAFAGTVDFGISVGGIVVSNTTDVLQTPPFTNQQIGLAAYETVPCFFHIKTNPAYFAAPQQDIIVVWPISNKPYIDSIIIPIYVSQDPTAGIDQQVWKGLHCFAFGDKLILSAPASVSLERVRILDVSGREVLFELQPGGMVQLAQLSSGVYVVEVIAADKQRLVTKIIH